MAPSKEEKLASKKRADFLKNLPAGSHVHIIGVCGTGTSGLANLLSQRGFKVSGSDQSFYPPIGDIVKSYCNKVFTSYSKSNLDPKPDLVVIGNSARKDNEEVCYVFEENLPYVSMPEAFSAILIGDRETCPTSVVVCGTHGKTTTTTSIAYVLESLGLKPGYFIGGVPNDLSSGISGVDMALPLQDRVVVLEGDEYDSACFAKWAKFHSYRPDILIIGSLEFDHADIYSSIEEIASEFSEVAKEVPESGVILISDMYPTLLDLAKKWQADSEIKAKIVFYGKSSFSEYRLLKREQGEEQQHIEFELDSKKYSFDTSLLAEYNALNLLACYSVCDLLFKRGVSLDLDNVRSSLREFKGVKRRQSLIAKSKNNILLFEDFAHHPTAVSQTLEAFKERFLGRRIIALFEPRSNTSRRKIFQSSYAESLAKADMLMILEPELQAMYSKDNKKIEVLDIEELKKETSLNASKEFFVSSFRDVDKLIECLMSRAREGDVIVLMSNGSFGGAVKELAKRINNLL